MELKVKTHSFSHRGIDFTLQDLETSGTLDFVIKDLQNNAYGIHDIAEPELIVDLGAHVGLISIYLAKKYPKAKIIAVEPFMLNALNLKHNIKANQCDNITVIEKAITKDSRLIDIGCTEVNTGGAMHFWGTGKPHIESITLSDLLKPYEKISFLKMDIEGYEFEVLEDFKDWHKIHDAGIEIHNQMVDLGGTIEQIKLLKELLNIVPITGRMWTPPIEAFFDENTTNTNAK